MAEPQVKRSNQAARRGQPVWPFATVAALVLVGLVVAVVHSWRIGGAVIGGALVLGALLRAVLPARAAGLLQVRSRGFDMVVMAFGGAAIVVLSYVVPGG